MAVSRYFSNSQLAERVNIANGRTLGASHIHKFGATDGDVTAGTIWDGNSAAVEYPYPAQGLVTVAGATTADDGKTVEVSGLDINYAPVTETLTVGGAASVAIFSRVFRARMVSAENTIDLEIDLDGVLAAKILAGLGQTLMAVYTVPAGKTAYLLDLHVGSDKASTNTSMTYRLFARPFGEAFNIKCNFNVAGGQNLDINYSIPLEFTEKTDLRVDVVAGQATTCSATFDLLLVDN